MNEEVVRGYLADKIADEEFVDWACEKEGIFRFIVYQGMDIMKCDISELNLSVRSYNCLKRKGYETIGALVNDVDRLEDFSKIRNLGRRSVGEVIMKLFICTYENLKPEKRKSYLEKVRSIN